jgi:peroxiredoxin
VSFAVSLSQLLLTLVFAVAAVAKLADRSATRLAIEAFGVPPRPARALALLLPIAELAIAAVLVPAATARWGALAAVALLLIFSVAIARTLQAGSAPDCNCFGGLTQTEVGRGTLIRNLLLGAVAAFVALAGQQVSALRWITVPAAQDRPGILFLVACLAGLSWFCWQLLQQNGRLLLRLEAEGAGAGAPKPGAGALPPLEPGSAAPRFAGQDLQGRPVSLDSLLAPGRPVALFFTDPGCGACESALEAVAEAQRERAEELTLAVISRGSIERIKEKAAKFGLNRVVPQDDDALADAYRVYGVPGVVEIDGNGSLSRPAALGIDAVREVVLGIPPEPPHESVGLAAR